MHVPFLFSLHLFYMSPQVEKEILECAFGRTCIPFALILPFLIFRDLEKSGTFTLFFHNPFIHFLIYIFLLEPFILFFILRYGRSAIGMMETNLTEAETLISGRAATWSNKLWYRTGDKGCQESPDMTPIFDRQKK